MVRFGSIRHGACCTVRLRGWAAARRAQVPGNGGLASRSSRCRFAARLNSGVRPLNQNSLLVHAIATGYVAFSLWGLLVISVPSNRQSMFEERGIGRFQLAHACLMFALILACGTSVWIWPSAVVPLAVTVLLAVLIGKAVCVAKGEWRYCKRCILVGPIVVLATTATLVVTFR